MERLRSRLQTDQYIKGLRATLVSHANKIERKFILKQQENIDLKTVRQIRSDATDLRKALNGLMGEIQQPDIGSLNDIAKAVGIIEDTCTGLFYCYRDKDFSRYANIVRTQLKPNLCNFRDNHKKLFGE